MLKEDPLSPYLFVVAIESLALAIRNNPAIRGIMIDKEETKLLQYADDMTAVLSDKPGSSSLYTRTPKESGLDLLRIIEPNLSVLNRRKNLLERLGFSIRMAKNWYVKKKFMERLDSIKKTY